MKRIVIVFAAVIASLLVSAGVASADTGVWRAYGDTNPITSSDSTWGCASSQPIATNVVAQVCAVRSSSGTSVQAAVIVRNNRSSLYAATAAMDLYTLSGTGLGVWSCPSSGVAATSWSVCFGTTLTQSNWVNSYGSASGTPLGYSPYV